MVSSITYGASATSGIGRLVRRAARGSLAQRAALGGGAALAAGMAAVLIGSTLANANQSDAALERHRADRMAHALKGDYSERALDGMLAQMDPEAVKLAMRLDPRREQPRLDPISPGRKLDAELLGVLPGLTPQQAIAVNSGFPFSTDPNPAAKPFTLRGASLQDRNAALGCLTQAVYYEAGFEPIEGEQAVAQAVLNRVRHPAFPKTVCGVVFEGSAQHTGCQFSFTCDGSLSRPAQPEAWARARAVAERALDGFVMTKIGGATHYHAQYVAPYWAPTLAKVQQIGAHIFYRWPGDWGLPAAFHGKYAGGERPGFDVGGDPLAMPGAPPELFDHAKAGAAGPVLTLSAPPPPPVLLRASAAAPNAAPASTATQAAVSQTLAAGQPPAEAAAEAAPPLLADLTSTLPEAPKINLEPVRPRAPPRLPMPSSFR